MRFYRENNLQDLALNIVVHHFGDYYFKYESCPGNDLFLKRKYSDKIYQLLEKKNMLEERYVSWLISPHFRNVVIDPSHFISEYASQLRLNGDVIHSISFENCAASVDILSAIICLIPNVTDINLNCTNCDDDLLLLIRKMCPKLASLSLIECEVSDAGMQKLCYLNRKKVGFDSLKTLNIQSTSVSHNGVVYILKNLKLEALHFLILPKVMHQLHKKNAKDLNTWNLKEVHYFISRYVGFSIASPPLEEVLKMWICLCPNVEKVGIVDMMEDTHFDLLCQLENVNCFQFISFREWETPGLSEYFLMRGSNLTALTLQNVVISIEIILRACPHLQKLVLCSVLYDDFDELDVEKYVLKDLTLLKLLDVDLRDEDAYKSMDALLKCCRNIKKLSIRSVRSFPEEFVDVILEMPFLETAKFELSDLKQASVPKLFTSKNITRLYLDGCPFVRLNEFDDIFQQQYSKRKGNTLSWQIEYTRDGLML